jgi:hypothetical protein
MELISDFSFPDFTDIMMRCEDQDPNMLKIRNIRIELLSEFYP